MTDDYPGKFYKWTPVIEERALALESRGFSTRDIATALNAEFPQINLCTRSAVIGKLNRMRKIAPTRTRFSSVA